VAKYIETFIKLRKSEREYSSLRNQFLRLSMMISPQHLQLSTDWHQRVFLKETLIQLRHIEKMRDRDRGRAIRIYIVWKQNERNVLYSEKIRSLAENFDFSSGIFWKSIGNMK
jgi:hypothetical protein